MSMSELKSESFCSKVDVTLTQHNSKFRTCLTHKPPHTDPAAQSEDINVLNMESRTNIYVQHSHTFTPTQRSAWVVYIFCMYIASLNVRTYLVILMKIEMKFETKWTGHKKIISFLSRPFSLTQFVQKCEFLTIFPFGSDSFSEQDYCFCSYFKYFKLLIGFWRNSSPPK